MALVLLALAAYFSSLNGSFHFDDQGIFLDPAIVSPGFGLDIFRLTQTRPLTFLTFHWNDLANGADPFGYHLVNIGIHACSAVLVTLLARAVLPPAAALFAGTFFALHPIQTQAVNYVFERATLLAAFPALASLLMFLRDRYLLSALLFALSLLAKEETIALPGLMVLLSIAWRRPVSWPRFSVIVLPAVLAAARLFYVLHVTAEPTLGFGLRISSVEYLLTQCRVLWMYLRLILIPAGLNLQHDVRLSTGVFTPPATLPALLLMLLLLAVLGWLVVRRSEPALWGLGFFILIAPSSTIVPAQDLSFEHRVYFPLVCIALAAASLLNRLPSGYRLSVALLTLTVYFFATMQRNAVWHDDISLWSDVTAKSPKKARGYFQLGQAYAQARPAYARDLYEAGLRIEPANATARSNLALLLLDGGDYEGALKQFRQALESDAGNALVWNNLGAAQLRRGEVEEGIASFRQAIQHDPCRFDARMNLMRALKYLNRTAEAQAVGRTPAHCRYLPDQIRQLEAERSSAGSGG